MGTAWGGGENYDYHLALSLQSLGHRVLMFTGCRWGETPARSIGSIEATGIATPYLRQYMYKLAGKVKLLPGFVSQLDLRLFTHAAWSPLQSLLHERSIDVVQILGIPHLTSALLSHGHPTVMRFPGPPAWFQSPQLRRIGIRPQAAMFTHGDAVRHFREKIGIGVEEIPPGVDTALFHPDPDGQARAEVRSALGLSNDDFLLITVGRLIDGKGYEFLIEGMAQRVLVGGPEKLVIVGDGALRQRLERRVFALGLDRRVVFTGHLPKQQVARHLQAADCFCLFSGYENYSNAAMEAMSTGLPVLASRVGGFPLQIRNGVNGFLIEPGNHQQLLDRLTEIRSSAGLRQRLSDGARRFAAPFNWKRSAERVTEIYERVHAS